jgi:hypothetical protein
VVKSHKHNNHYLTLHRTDEFIKDVGLTGLTQQEEWANRERKMSVDGVDIRRFSNSRKSGFEPQDDPYYGRKMVNSTLRQNPNPPTHRPLTPHPQKPSSKASATPA